MQNQHILQLENISFAYAKQEILENLSLELEEGNFLGLIGPNGGGKTTLLKLILGLLPLQAGKLRLFGQDVDQFRDWTKLSYVAQEAGFNTQGFPVTVEEVLSMTGAKQDKIAATLELVDMSKYLHQQINQLSGGLRQRVFIARALLNQPKLLILDEPTVGVDHRAQSKFYNVLKKLNQQQGLSIILVSHEIDVVSSVVNKVACLNKTLVYHGDSAKLSSQDLLHKLYGPTQQLIAHHH